MGKIISSYKELNVYDRAMNMAMEIFRITKRFPSEEKYSLTDQMKRSSRSVCSNLAEAWRKRRYKAAFISKLSDAETEACETQVWSEIARRCNYITKEEAEHLEEETDRIMGQIVMMIESADKWVIKSPSRRFSESPVLSGTSSSSHEPFRGV
ncbi:MAG: four helix bundle protein [Candidatus Omnitrophica bacterium]|nr:four helix bundle protein [Candidatus Omnitrophota bacterium]